MFCSSSGQSKKTGRKAGDSRFPFLIIALMLVIAMVPAISAENNTGIPLLDSSFGNSSQASVPVVQATTLPILTSPPATSAIPTTIATTVVTTVPTTQVTTQVTVSIKKPKIEFTVTPVEGPAPLTITVYPVFNPEGGAPQYVIVDFGDGQQVNDTLKTSYEHTYPAAGSYLVTLTSVNAGGSNSEIIPSPIKVLIPVAIPTTTVSTSVTTAVATTIVTTTAPVTNATLSTATNQTGVQNTTISNGTTPLSQATENITESSSPCRLPNMTIADFTATPVEGPAPLKVIFSDNSTCAPPVAWQWDFGSPVNPGVKGMRDPEVTYAEPGTYNVTLLVINSFNNNSTKTKTGVIHVLAPVTQTPYPTIVPTPVPVPTIETNFSANITSGVAPLSVQFTDMSSGAAITSWFWDFGDGANASMKNPVHIYNKTGNFTVILKTAPASGTPFVKARESYILVSTPSGTIPLEIIGVIALIIVIALVAVVVLRARKPQHAHHSGHSEEMVEEEHESGGSSHSRHGKDL